jgi:hypothetical protein
MPFKASDDRIAIGSLADAWDSLDNDSKHVIAVNHPELFMWLNVFSSLAFQGRISVDVDCAFCGDEISRCKCPKTL